MLSATTPDAAYVPGVLREGRTMPERLASVLRIAEPLLGVDRARGGRGYVRALESGGGLHPAVWLFVTRDPEDTLLFPAAGPFGGRPRYDWVEGPRGVRLGYLVAEARALAATPDRPPGT